MHDVKGATAVFDIQAVNVGLNLELNGANIEQVDAGAIVVGRILSADAARIGEFELVDAKIDGDLQASQANITKTLDLNSANLRGSLILRDCNCGLIDIDVTVASVGNAAQFNNGKFHNLLGFGVRVDNRLEAIGATFNSVDLRDAQVTGAVDLDDISVADKIDLSNLNAKGALSIGRSSQKSAPKIGSFNVSGSTIAGDLNLDHLTFGASIYASGSEIGGNLLLHDLFESDTTKPASIDFSGSKVSQSILLSPVSINGDINLSRTVIGNALWLRPNDQGFTWRPSTNIQLSNTKTTLLMGELANWKTSADTWVSANLTGFSYDEIASVPKHASASTKPGCEGDMYFANVDCLIAWLSVNKSPISGGQAAGGFNPGAYEQLAATLQRMGRLDDAKDVLFASGIRRLQTSAWPNNIFVFITALTGFGQRPYYLLILLGLLFALGYIISFWSHDLCERDRRETFRQELRHWARSSPRHPLVRLGSVARPAKPLVAGALVFCFCNGFRRLLYAVDNGLPMGITLVKSHENISHENNPWVLCFFVIQKGLGYAIFLIAFAALVQSLIPKT